MLTLWLYKRCLIDKIINRQWGTVFPAFPIKEDIWDRRMRLCTCKCETLSCAQPLLWVCEIKRDMHFSQSLSWCLFLFTLYCKIHIKHNANDQAEVQTREDTFSSTPFSSTALQRTTTLTISRSYMQLWRHSHLIYSLKIWVYFQLLLYHLWA